MATEGNRLACPNCGKPDRIGEYVAGWREIGAAYALSGGGFRVEGGYGGVEDPEHQAFFCSGDSCNVDEEIPFHRMLQLDREGKPLPAIHPRQERLA